MIRVYLAGSGAFGADALRTLQAHNANVVGVAAPAEGRRGGPDLLRLAAHRADLPWTDTPRLAPDTVPDGTDLILTAHSHAFVGRLTRSRARYALGYHPSLLPLHRGRDAVRWQARLGERVVGGTMYHLTDRVDGGPIAYQRHLIVPPGIDASALWRDHLYGLGLDLIGETVAGVAADSVPTRPQNDAHATWEPAFDGEPLYRPELLEITR